MDDEQERRCLQVLAQEAEAGKTMVIVTHKTSILPLVNRIILVLGNQILMDGPRDAVLQELQKRTQVGINNPSNKPGQLFETAPQAGEVKA